MIDIEDLFEDDLDENGIRRIKNIEPVSMVSLGSLITMEEQSKEEDVW